MKEVPVSFKTYFAVGGCLLFVDIIAIVYAYVNELNGWGLIPILIGLYLWAYGTEPTLPAKKDDENE